MRSNIKPQFINEWKFNPLPSTDTRTNVVVLRKRKMKLLSCTKKEEEVPPPTIDGEDGRIRRTVTNHSNSASSNGFPNCYCFSCFHILFDRDPSTNLTHTLLYLSFWQHPSKAFGASTTKATEPTAKDDIVCRIWQIYIKALQTSNATHYIKICAGEQKKRER